MNNKKRKLAAIQYLGYGIVDLISAQLDEMPGINSIDPILIFFPNKR